MSKAKMHAAREFIQEKQYDVARTILQNTEHELANEWLEKLNQIAPPELDLPKIVVNDADSPRTPRIQSEISLVVMIASSLIGVGFFILPWSKGLAISAFDALRVTSTLAAFGGSNASTASSIDMYMLYLIPFTVVWSIITAILTLNRNFTAPRTAWGFCLLIALISLYPFLRGLTGTGSSIDNLDFGFWLSGGGIVFLIFVISVGLFSDLP